ncbi:hypothetical protein [Candidatus Odyssella thessalonicensis]|uniref:hypothetical protein n=1 Tax=Candidatus Odyssella thessalonicensis TaxID=84647 RepID=UPI000225B21A|nr:hypothetical protein [Candidatus Odyssella thessalonicensis]
MGVDIGYHAIKPNIIYEELIPYFMGKTDNVDRLLRQLARVWKNRIIANNFSTLISSTIIESREQLALFERLKRKIFSSSFPYFNPDLHIWGRPFFTVELDKDRMVDIITRFTTAVTDQEVLYIIKSQADLLGKSLFDNILPKIKDSLDEVVLEDLINDLSSMVQRIKAMVEAAIYKNPFMGENGDKVDLCDELSNPFKLIDLLALGTPAWMDHGNVSPSLLILEAGLDFPPYFNYSRCLMGEIGKKVKLRRSRIIEENYCLGVVVYPEDMATFLQFIDQHQRRFKEILIKKDWSSTDIELSLQKMKEAVCFCLKTQSLFVESADIFCPFSGHIP